MRASEFSAADFSALELLFAHPFTNSLNTEVNDEFALLTPGEAGAGVSREDFINKIACDILEKLPEAFDVDAVS